MKERISILGKTPALVPSVQLRALSSARGLFSLPLSLPGKGRRFSLPILVMPVTHMLVHRLTPSTINLKD